MVYLSFGHLMKMEFDNVINTKRSHPWLSLALKSMLIFKSKLNLLENGVNWIPEHVIGTSDLHSFLYMLESSMLFYWIRTSVTLHEEGKRSRCRGGGTSSPTTMIALKSLLIWMGDMSLFNSHSNWCESNQKGEIWRRRSKQSHLAFYCKGLNAYKCVISFYLDHKIHSMHVMSM